MDSKRIKIDKIHKLTNLKKKKKISPPFGILHISRYDMLPSSTLFC